MRAPLALMILLATTGISHAEIGGVPAGLGDAMAARAMLGGDVWARLVRIDNGGPRRSPRRSMYPKTVYALVFELSGILWFYTDSDGTQSLSLTTGTLERDKADPGPLFRAIDPGFGSWSWLGETRGTSSRASRAPPNSCVEESIAALARRVMVGGQADSPRLLFYYVDTPGGRLGHTVLLFTAQGGLEAVDAESSERPIIVPSYLGADPRSISTYLRGGPVAAARTLPILFTGKAPSAGRWAAIPRDAGSAG